MKHIISRYIMTLVALFAMTAGAWAEDHEYVDLGLPSGTLWATCNMGANSPEQYGDRYAWGETAARTTFNWSNYLLNVGSGTHNILKYCSDASWGYNGFTDGLTRLLPEDDAATVNWGKEWRMPTQDDFRELVANTTQESTTIGSVKGMKFISKTDPDVYIFLPYNGQYENSLFDVNAMGHYWSSDGRHDGGYQFRIQDTNWTDTETGAGRAAGMCIRPVSQPVVYNEARTQATFAMPAFDATVDYELVRDMTQDMTTQVGDGTDGYRIRLKKNEQGEGYVPAEMTPQAMAGLITVTDDIEEKTLTNVTDYTVQIFAVDEQGQITGDAINFASLVPGSYVAVATAADGSTYDGSTDMSNVFQLFEGYEVEVPAGEFVTYYKDEALTVEDDEAQLYTITAVSETTATATPFDVIPANVPLLLKNNSSETRTILLIPTEDPLAFMHYSGFVGSLDPTTIAASTETQTNYACNGKAFVYVKDAISAGANKAWLEIPASANGARQLKIVFADATGISAVSGLPADNGDWYDLNGRKLDGIPTKKGVYIKDGKKVVIK